VRDPHEHDHHLRNSPVADASVRLAKVSDAPAVGFVQAVLWTEVYAGLLAPEVTADFAPRSFAKVWRNSLEAPPSPAHRLLVACAGEQVVGFAAVGPSTDPDAQDGDGEILVLGIHPEARRVGHGSRLLNASVDTGRGSGFRALSAWLPSEAEATRAFLVAGGFAPDGAFRDRVIGPDESDVLREVRLRSAIHP
jgi:ribosomal protein S18 acetylase RimI-like enzyme